MKNAFKYYNKLKRLIKHDKRILMGLCKPVKVLSFHCLVTHTMSPKKTKFIS